ncbi:hypothetical protein [Streptomyces sp. NPDC001744]|uniref:hypothetical protein n=1 Tax=Streptomyces sp. NPDC001744 TaxID=3364606 RepID=UPI00367DEB3E
MKKPTGKLAVTAGATVSAFVLAVSPASAVASTTWTVTPSPVAFSSASGTNLTLGLNGFSVVCGQPGISGTLESATGNPAAIGNVTALVFGTSCASPLGNATVAPALPWSIVALDHTATTGVTKGHFGNVDLKTTVGACSFRTTGKASLTYTNSTGRLAANSVAGELTVVSAVNCGAVVPVGSKPTLKFEHSIRKTGTTTVPTIVGTNP